MGAIVYIKDRGKKGKRFFQSYPKTFAIIALFILVLAVPLTVFIAQKQQEIRQRASQRTDCVNVCSATLSQCLPTCSEQDCATTCNRNYEDCMNGCPPEETTATCSDGQHRVGDKWGECHGCDEGEVRCIGQDQYSAWELKRSNSPSCGSNCAPPNNCTQDGFKDGGCTTKTAADCQQLGPDCRPFTPTCTNSNGTYCKDDYCVNSSGQTCSTQCAEEGYKDSGCTKKTDAQCKQLGSDCRPFTPTCTNSNGTYCKDDYCVNSSGNACTSTPPSTCPAKTCEYSAIDTNCQSGITICTGSGATAFNDPGCKFTEGCDGCGCYTEPPLPPPPVECTDELTCEYSEVDTTCSSGYKICSGVGATGFNTGCKYKYGCTTCKCYESPILTGRRTAEQVCTENNGQLTDDCTAGGQECKTNGGVCCTAKGNSCCYGDSVTRKDGNCYPGSSPNGITCANGVIKNNDSKSVTFHYYTFSGASCPMTTAKGEGDKTLAAGESISASCEQIEAVGYCGACDSSKCSTTPTIPPPPPPPPTITFPPGCPTIGNVTNIRIECPYCK